MGDWDAVFDETYLQTYGPLDDVERNREQALAAVTLAEVEPGAEILDCPCGFGRHALPLAESGYVVTGFDRRQASSQRPSAGAGPRSGRGSFVATIGELPFADASFDAVLNVVLVSRLPRARRGRERHA